MINNTRILFIILWSAIHITHAETVDNLLGEEVFENTDQVMHSGDVNKTNLNAKQVAFNNSKLIDNIKECNYKTNEICKIIIRERMPTIIKLPKYEWIEDWLLGDDINFELNTINNLTNAISIKSYYPGIDTNLNIIGGSGFIYSFYIVSNGIDAKEVSDFIVNIKADDKTLEQIAQAKRFYKDRPIPDETLNDVVSFNLKNHSLHTAFKKILPRDWNLNIDKKLQARDRLFDVISEDQTRRQTILDLAEKLNLKAMFYPKIRLLVITDNYEVIE